MPEQGQGLAWEEQAGKEPSRGGQGGRSGRLFCVNHWLSQVLWKTHCEPPDWERGQNPSDLRSGSVPSTTVQRVVV